MSLREEMRKYEQITGESAEHVPIIKLGAFLDGYEKGIKALGRTSYKSEARRWKRRYLDLKQRIFKMEERTSWIPVSEKLPEPDMAVLLTVRYKSSGQWTYQIGYWEDALEKWEKWLEIGTLDDEFEILAWMELPEGYKEDKHE